MKIKDVRITLLTAPYIEQPALQRGYDKDRDILMLEIETQSGLVGLGYQLYLREGFRTTKACLEEVLIPRIIGRDATEVEAIWRDLFMVTQADGRGGAPILGLSVIDVALWDLVGQKAGLPLHRLWGHFRDEVPAYGSGVWRGLGGDDLVFLGRIGRSKRRTAYPRSVRRPLRDLLLTPAAESGTGPSVDEAEEPQGRESQVSL